jgi:aspartyl-tRNA(Asn)/glutamyl-tRNA(Gln) amidotransferase subunit A
LDKARGIVQCLGAEAVEVSIPSIEYALPTYYIIALCEASSNLSRCDGVRYGFRASEVEDINGLHERTRALGLGAEVKRRIVLGTYALSSGYCDAYYRKASKVRARIAYEFTAALRDVDAMFMPTTPTGAFQIGSHTSDPVKMYLEDVFTVPINLAGLPALSIPVTQDVRGMPLGLQVVGDPIVRSVKPSPALLA